MTDDNKTYEEPEVVTGASTTHSREEHIQDVFRDFAREGMGEAQKNLLWSAFWPVVWILFVFFVVVGLLITILFWALPFATAALIIAFIFFGGLTLVQGVINFFKK